MGRIIIPLDYMDTETLLENVADILSKLHYDVIVCKTCGWFLHEDETSDWLECAGCCDDICTECVPYDDHDKKIYCYACGDKKD